MHLTTFVMPLGYHRNSWCRPGSRAEEVPGLDFLTDIAQMAEAAKLDALFFGDVAHATATLRGDTMMNGFYEPMTTLSALAAVTRNIGLIGTLSTSLNEPYNVARLLASLDHLSGGRAGWNIVTSADGYRNFGIDAAPDPAERYRRSEEFVGVVEALWDSWSDDAVIVDRDNARWLDTAKLRKIDFSGEYFDVEGPLNMPRPPQGRPVLVQAGSSGPGMNLGSSAANVIYTAQPDLAQAVEFYANMKELVAGKGRAPEDVKIIPGIVPVVADTQAEADELTAELSSYLDVEQGRLQIAGDLNVDLSDVELDDPIPAERFEGIGALSSRQGIYRRKSVEQGLSLRSLIFDRARSTGHQWVAGTPATIADRMQGWFEGRACDGFNLNSPFNPEGFERICTKLIPELQNRGLFRTEYAGPTLRDHFGIARPDNIF
ncbi:LLM class flavin-dependent oxidoreductase [Microbacterium sp. LRZ72]|uniref:LLM class flavin-dependent oxidoreductase n=1 Tax=Microbacterium sp. LRZ72 TaxID=2942481 RepID=UPI0029A015BF|nr:LLM class flavin-dependent oxidoreductase [Microbacterium sp. LRZ72]MDX2376369.1 LLM class flavin-dependent oxidoreductase [Microbacterium sp. LRZ72]